MNEKENRKRYGWFSRGQFNMRAAAGLTRGSIYSTPQGREVTVTGVYRAGEEDGSLWMDREPRGEVVQWLRNA